MHPAAVFDEQRPALLWDALGEKLRSARSVFDPSWAVQRLGARDLFAWLGDPSSRLADDPAAWSRPTTRLAVLRINDLRRVSGLFRLAHCHEALRHCIDGRAMRELRRDWGHGTLDALYDDPPFQACAATPIDWNVEQLCDEGAAGLMAGRDAQDWAWRLLRAAFPRSLPPPVSAAHTTASADEFLDWCASHLKGEAWWSG